MPGAVWSLTAFSSALAKENSSIKVFGNLQNLRTRSARIHIRAERKDSKILLEYRIFVQAESFQPLGLN